MLTTKEDKYKTILKNTRFYKNKLPEVDEYVLTFIKGFQHMGIDCSINEYKTDAFMSFKDASSSKKLRNIRKEVIKGRNYILVVTKVDRTKGFIDVEKRSIDKEIEKKYTDLINFYQRIFNIFVKTYVFNNLECSQEDVYAFLENTLWKQNAKQIKDNMITIHTCPKEIKNKYNLNSYDIGDTIIDNITKIVPEPKCKITVQLKINSLALDAISDIKDTLGELVKITGHEFKITSAPIYTCEFIDDFKSSDHLDSLNIRFNAESGEIGKFIKNYKKDNLYIQNIETGVTLVEV